MGVELPQAQATAGADLRRTSQEESLWDASQINVATHYKLGRICASQCSILPRILPQVGLFRKLASLAPLRNVFLE
jgi:hypothetical protein